MHRLQKEEEIGMIRKLWEIFKIKIKRCGQRFSKNSRKLECDKKFANMTG